MPFLTPIFRDEEFYNYIGGNGEEPAGAPLNRWEEWMLWLASAITGQIEAIAGIYRGNFATVAALNAVQWQTEDPTAEHYVTNNDWAVVLADETHANACWRYGYTVDVGWQAEFKINDTPMTETQWAAIDSGITAEILSTLQSAKMPTGGTAGQFLVKQSSTNYDAAWTTVPDANGQEF